MKQIEGGSLSAMRRILESLANDSGDVSADVDGA